MSSGGLQNRRGNRRSARESVIRCHRIIFRPKTEYKTRTAKCGMLILGKRKRDFLTPEEWAAKKKVQREKQVETAKNKIHALLIHHKITALWEHDMFMNNFRFGSKNVKKIIEYLQATFENMQSTIVRSLLSTGQSGGLKPHRPIHTWIPCGTAGAKISLPQNAKILQSLHCVTNYLHCQKRTRRKFKDSWRPEELLFRRRRFSELRRISSFFGLSRGTLTS